MAIAGNVPGKFKYRLDNKSCSTLPYLTLRTILAVTMTFWKSGEFDTVKANLGQSCKHIVVYMFMFSLNNVTTLRVQPKNTAA